MSLAKNLLAIVAKDAGGALAANLTTFQSSIDAAPSVEGAVAAGAQLEANLVTALPTVEGGLIKDTTDLLVQDAVAEIVALQQQAAASAKAG